MDRNYNYIMNTNDFVMYTNHILIIYTIYIVFNQILILDIKSCNVDDPRDCNASTTVCTIGPK